MIRSNRTRTLNTGSDEELESNSHSELNAGRALAESEKPRLDFFADGNFFLSSNRPTAFTRCHECDERLMEQRVGRKTSMRK